MKYDLFFPYPIQHDGLFKNRSIVINHYSQRHANENNFHFQKTSPHAEEIHQYFQLIKKNPFSKEYIGELVTEKNSWKFLSATNDLKNIYDGMIYVLDSNIKNAYFMTNSAGHHADNPKYQLFCPLNHLFFIVELLNYHTNFPNIFWIDIDAHFGDGDKEKFDKYKIKMSNESNNLSGVSLHNDTGGFQESDYIAINYENDISEINFLDMLKNIHIDNKPSYILLFFGTDIFRGDYGGNKNISKKIIPEILSHFEYMSEKQDATLITIQTGGSDYENVEELIDQISKR